MKQKIVLFLFFPLLNLFSTSQCVSQTFFQYQYGSAYKDETNSKGLSHSNHLYVLTQSNDINYFLSSFKIVKYDSLMNKLSEREIVPPGSGRATDISTISDSSFLITGLSLDTLNYYNVQSTVLILLNNNCDTLWTTRLHLDSIDVSLSFVHTYGDTILLYGTLGKYQAETSNPVFVKINKTNGTIISTTLTTIDTLYTFSRGKKCIFNPVDSSYFSISHTFDTINYIDKLSIIKYDLNLNPQVGYYLNGDAAPQADITSFHENILICYTQFMPSGRNTVVLKLDSMLNLLWAKEYSNIADNTFQNIETIEKDSTIILSNYAKIEELDYSGNLLSEKIIIDPNQFPFASLLITDIVPISDSTILTLSNRKINITQSFDLVINKANKNGTGCSNINSSLFSQNTIINMQPILPITNSSNVIQINDLIFKSDTTTCKYPQNPDNLKVEKKL